MRSIDDAVDILRFLETDIGGTGIEEEKIIRKLETDTRSRKKIMALLAMMEEAGYIDFDPSGKYSIRFKGLIFIDEFQ